MREMVEGFVKGKEYIRNNAFYRTVKVTPIYMMKDNKKYFVKNIIKEINEDTYSRLRYKRDLERIEKIKDMLISNNGSYYMNFGYHYNPIDLISYVTENNYTFEKCTNINQYENYIVFGGNLKEVSNAFEYVIYDLEIIEKIKGLYSSINIK